jgi:hypothetical protein
MSRHQDRSRVRNSASSLVVVVRSEGDVTANQGVGFKHLNVKTKDRRETHTTVHRLERMDAHDVVCTTHYMPIVQRAIEAGFAITAKNRAIFQLCVSQLGMVVHRLEAGMLKLSKRIVLIAAFCSALWLKCRNVIFVHASETDILLSPSIF